MKALITGISGFSGTHLAQLLKKKGLQVSGIDKDKQTKYVNCNLTNKQKVFRVVKETKPDFIFHLASPLIRSDQLIDKSLEKNLEVDLFGSVNLLLAAAELNKKPRILISGTAAVYQEAGKKALIETSPLQPITSYGLSKLTQELVCRKLADSYGLPLILTRTFLLVGPGQKPGFVITDFAKQVAEIEIGKRPAVLKTGNLNVRRDFTDVRDTALAYWLLIKEGKPGETFNVSSGKSQSLKTVVSFFQQQSKKKFVVKQDKQRLRQNDPNEVIGNNQKIKKAVGWQPKIGFEESLLNTLHYWRRIVVKA